MTTDMFKLWGSQAALANGFAAMGPFAGFVVAQRLAQMAMETGNPTAAGTAEINLMMSEKMKAIFDGALAAGMVMARLPMAGTPMAAAHLMVAAGEAAMKPTSRAVRANARRLASRG